MKCEISRFKDNSAADLNQHFLKKIFFSIGPIFSDGVTYIHSGILYTECIIVALYSFLTL